MHIFEWDDSYSVKVDRLDEQHKHFFEIVKELHKALENKEDRIAMAIT